MREALAFLLEESRTDFREAAHTLPFPRNQGFLVDRDFQTGDVFARALIADALLDAREEPGVAEVLDREINYLVDSRVRDGVGGWKYFPELRELPPDADDLAQVMQVLLRSGRRDDARRYCERPLEVLFRDNAHPDGSFETWIVPRQNRSFDEELQTKWIEVAWGYGPDPEVMANLLYALSLYDKERFRDEIARGIAFIESRQDASGAWLSTWYHGPFYGTCVVLRLLAACAPKSPAIERAVSFLRNAERNEGGWGDPLSSALAIMALTSVGVQPANRTTIRSVDEPVPFIRMELGRMTGQSWQTLTYASRCITAAFVLKAGTARRGIDSEGRDVQCFAVPITHKEPR